MTGLGSTIAMYDFQELGDYLQNEEFTFQRFSKKNVWNVLMKR